MTEQEQCEFIDCANRLDDSAEEAELQARKWAAWSRMSVANGANHDRRDGHFAANARNLRNASDHIRKYVLENQ